MLKKEYDYYIKNKTDLLAKYEGKFIAIKNGKVLGAFNSRDEALVQTIKDHKLGTFLVHHVQKEEDELNFFNRVLFTDVAS